MEVKDKNYISKLRDVTDEINKVIVGKEDIVQKVLMAILSDGHVLLDDIPGVGKTTLALAISKTLGLEFNRVQFTPDVVPSDITGFSMYNKETGKFEYRPGAAMCNFLLADEINRTSSKTQSALLEVMQEGKITVDGETREVPSPFVVIATQNPFGSAGTQLLPEAQVDRFMIQLSMGYPTPEEQVKIMEDRNGREPLDEVKNIITAEELGKLKQECSEIYIDTKITKYIADLVETSRHNEYVKLGLSPRGAIATMKMAKAFSFMSGRDYVTPEDVRAVFPQVAIHRLILSAKAQMENKTKQDVIEEIISKSPAPQIYDKEIKFAKVKK